MCILIVYLRRFSFLTLTTATYTRFLAATTTNGGVEECISIALWTDTHTVACATQLFGSCRIATEHATYQVTKSHSRTVTPSATKEVTHQLIGHVLAISLEVTRIVGVHF